MRAATQMMLVLMGGGAMTAAAAVSMESGRACGEAHARLDPDAAEICRSHGGGGFFGGSRRWYGGGDGMRADGTGGHAVSRGGFGLFGLHFSGLHG